MRNIRTIACVSVALLIVSMLAIGAVSAKAGEGGNGKMLKNNGDCICDGECLNAGVCPYDGDCPYDGECISSGDCIPNNYLHDYGNNK